MGAVDGRAERSPDVDSLRLPVRSPQKLLDAARESCERARIVIEESRALLGRHRSLMAGLRAPGPADASSDGTWRPALDLDDEFMVGSLRLLPLRRAVTGERARVLLTPAEWQLLAALVSNRSTILSRSDLATKAWGAGYAHRHGEVEVYVSRLRRKLARAGGSAHIQTFRGQGYRFSLGDGVRDESLRSVQSGDGAA